MNLNDFRRLRNSTFESQRKVMNVEEVPKRIQTKNDEDSKK